MRLAQHLTFRFALGASDVCLVGEMPTCSVPALLGCEGLWSYDYGYARISTLHPHGVGLCSRPSAGVRGFALLAHENVLKVRAAHRFDVEIPFFAWCVARPAACLYTQDSAVQRCGVNAGVFVLFFCFLRVFCSANILVCAFFFCFFLATGFQAFATATSVGRMV